MRAEDRPPSDYDDEPFLQKDQFVPHLLTVANNGYAWHASRLYLSVLGMGVNETRVLSILYEFGELQAWEICDILSMNKATVSQSLKKLESDGMLTITINRNGRFARPTPQSKSIHRKIMRMARSREEVLLDGFSQVERDQFKDYLSRFTQNIPKSIEYANKHFASDE